MNGIQQQRMSFDESCWNNSYYIQMIEENTQMDVCDIDTPPQPKPKQNFPSILKTPNITPQYLFQLSGIDEQIKQNISLFFTFCRKNREFTSRLFTICLKSSYEELEDQKVKKVAQAAMEVLTYDEDAFHNFLFGKNDKQQNNKSTDADIPQILPPTIQSQAEQLFTESPSSAKQDGYWQKYADAFDQFQLVALTTEQLKSQTINETCLGYINKLYTSSLRKDGNLFLEFLSRRPDFGDALVSKLYHYSIGYIISLVLSCEDRTGQYKYEALKASLFEKVLAFGLENIANSDNFDGFLSLIEQILNLTKQTYYEYFDDFKRCANVLVSSSTITKFYQYLDLDEISFANASTYLQLVLKRINTEMEQQEQIREQEQQYREQEQHNREQEPTMKFQHGFLFGVFDHLVELLEKSEKYHSTGKINYLGFLIQLIKNIKENSTTLKNQEAFQRIMGVYLLEQTSGLIKNYIYQVLTILAKRMNEQEIKSLADWLIQTSSNSQVLPDIAIKDNITQSNANQNYCFILSLLFEISKKQSHFLQDYNQRYNYNLIQIETRFGTKLADFGRKQCSLMSSNDDEIQLVLSFGEKVEEQQEIKNSIEVENKKQVEVQTVGKNQVSIPVLNLPSKNHAKVTIEEEQVETVEVDFSLSREALIKELKNTRIELPEKYKAKKINESDGRNSAGQSIARQESQRNGEKKNEQGQKVNSETLSNNISAVSNHLNSVGMPFYEQKYFIRHFLLF